MTREFLKGLGLDDASVEKILDENSRDIGKEKQKAEQHKTDLDAARQQLADREKDLEALKKTAGDAETTKKQLEDLQAKYTAESEAHMAEIAARDYDAAVAGHVADLNFSSKGAKAAFVAGLKEKKLELKDGKLDGFAQYLEEAKKADPESFAPEKPAPRFGRPAGGVPGTPKTTGEQMAEALGKSAADRAKCANDIISMYTGGN